MVHHYALAPEEDVEAAIAKPAADGGQLAQSSSHRGIIRSAAAIAN
jgi:hypothetical protein